MVECHSKVSLGVTWETCQSAIQEAPMTTLLVGNSMLRRAEEEVETILPLDKSDGGFMYSGPLQSEHVNRDSGSDEPDQESQTTRVSSAYHSQPSPSGLEDNEDLNRNGELKSIPVNLFKRFGGFLKSKYGYRKFVDPGRSFQKRYGGFIGVRKAARKWNNQKRFSEILKHYLGMTTRASEFNSMSTDLAQQNEE